MLFFYFYLFLLFIKIPDIEVRSKSVVLRGMDPSTNEDRVC